MVDIYRDAKRFGIYPPLFTDPEGDSCFNIYQIRWIKKRLFNFFFETFAKRRAIFLPVRKTVNIQGYSELRQSKRTKLLSTDLVNTNNNYHLTHSSLATHKDKRDRESVWVSLMKPRDQGFRGHPKQRESGPNRFKGEKGGCERGMARKTSAKIL